MVGRSEHILATEIKVRLSFPGMDSDTAWPTVEITYSFLPGAPATGPIWDSGGDPGYPAECDIISVKLIEDDNLNPTDAQLREWAQDWLDDWEGYNAACHHAEQERGEQMAEARGNYEDEGAF